MRSKLISPRSPRCGQLAFQSVPEKLAWWWSRIRLERVKSSSRRSRCNPTRRVRYRSASGCCGRTSPQAMSRRLRAARGDARGRFGVGGPCLRAGHAEHGDDGERRRDDQCPRRFHWGIRSGNHISGTRCALLNGLRISRPAVSCPAHGFAISASRSFERCRGPAGNPASSASIRYGGRQGRQSRSASCRRWREFLAGSWECPATSW